MLRRLPSTPVARMYSPFQAFVRNETAGGVVLLLCAAVALGAANSPWSEAYFGLWDRELSIEIQEWQLSRSLHWWIDEGLMVLFFFLVGLEIKREILVGELSSKRSAALPLAAAAGGMLVPAAIYLALNPAGMESRGWAIPMATDIAFALGILALLGDRVPVALKIFLAALAIVDDIGAVVVIAAFYTDRIVWTALGTGAVMLIGMLVANRLGFRAPIVYAALGIGLWLAFLASGVHATVAGVLAAFAIPARTSLDRAKFLVTGRAALDAFEQAERAPDGQLISAEQIAAVQMLETASEYVQTPLQRFEEGLGPWVSFLVVPLFALANAGVALTGGVALSDSVALGILLGLFVGKPIGVTAFAWLATRLGIASLPDGTSWKQIHGVSCVAGIGFTMSLFITALAFGQDDLVRAAKLGILAGSIASGVLGWLLLHRGKAGPASA